MGTVTYDLNPLWTFDVDLNHIVMKYWPSCTKIRAWVLPKALVVRVLIEWTFLSVLLFSMIYLGVKYLLHLVLTLSSAVF